MTNYYINKYLPQKQDLIWIDFEPSLGEEIKGRHPAIVMSSANYSKLTGLVMVMPITHAKTNRLREFFIPLHTKEIEGYRKRRVEFTGEIASPQDWARALMIHNEILDS